MWARIVRHGAQAWEGHVLMDQMVPCELLHAGNECLGEVVVGAVISIMCHVQYVSSLAVPDHQQHHAGFGGDEVLHAVLIEWGRQLQLFIPYMSQNLAVLWVSFEPSFVCCVVPRKAHDGGCSNSSLACGVHRPAYCLIHCCMVKARVGDGHACPLCIVAVSVCPKDLVPCMQGPVCHGVWAAIEWAGQSLFVSMEVLGNDICYR